MELSPKGESASAKVLASRSRRGRPDWVGIARELTVLTAPFEVDLGQSLSESEQKRPTRLGWDRKRIDRTHGAI